MRLVCLVLIVTAAMWTRCLAHDGAAHSPAPAMPTDTAAMLDTMRQLGTVTVTGAKPYNEVIPAQTLSGRQLDMLNSHSVADAIRYFAGVQIKDYGGVGGIKTVDVRSMGTNHMGVFYDGIQLGNAQNGQIDLGKFSLDNIEEISLYNGQKSDVFQPARDFGSAGTIYLRTRRPRFAQGKRDNLNATMRTGSFGLANPSLRWEHKFNDNVTMALNGEYTFATGQYHFRYRKRYSDGTMAWDTTAVRHNGDIHSQRLEGAAFGLVPQGRWQAKFYLYNSKKGIPGAIVNNVWKTAQRQWDCNFFTQGSFQKRFTPFYQLQVNGKYARDYMRYLNPDTTLMYINNRFWQDEIYLSAANCFTPIAGWDIDLSTDYQWNYLDATLQDFVYPTRHTLLTALATAVTWRKLKAQASVLHSFFNDRSTPRMGDVKMAHRVQSTNKFTPAVFLSYKPWEEHSLSLRAFYKRIFRMPTFNDLYYTDIGNANLKPEFVTQYNVGFLWERYAEGELFTALKLTADAYYNRVTDKIIAVPKGTGQYRWMMMNIGKVRIRGIDLTARAQARLSRDASADLNLTYTYQRAQDYTHPDDNGDGGTYKGQIAYIPWHSGSAVAHVAWRSLDVNYSFIYVGKRYHNSANILANREQPWYTHDCSASYAFAWGKTRLKLTCEVNNLLNQQYDVIQNYPMPGRNYRVILKFDI